jgi:histone acetyltransferase (RNA polymerase elongator complex component)
MACKLDKDCVFCDQQPDCDRVQICCDEKLAVKDAEIKKLEAYLQTAMFWFLDMKTEIARLEQENILVVEMYK